MEFGGKIAVITGAASGIGRAVAAAMAHRDVGAMALVDMGESFAIATGGVLTLTIAAAPNASSVWVRVIDEGSGAVFEQEVTADLPATAREITDAAERRSIAEWVKANAWPNQEVDRMTAWAPMIEVTIDDLAA